MDELTASKLIKLLCIDPESRSLSEILQATEILRSTQLLKSIAQQIDMHAAIETCARKMQLRYVTTNSPVARKGEETNEISLVVKGEVSVTMPQTLLTNKKRGSLRPTLLQSLLIHLTRRGAKREEHKYLRASNEIKLETQVTVVGVGCSFGDLAVVKGMPCIIAATATDETLLASIGVAEFNSTLRKVQDRLFHEKLELLGGLVYFNRLTAKKLYEVAKNIQYRSFRRKETVYTEGDVADSVFIIISGEFEFSKIFKAPEALKLPRMSRSISRKKMLRLYSKNSRELFGQEDLLERRTRYATCRCVSTKGEVYCIDRHDFTTIVMQGTAGEVLRDQHSLQESFRQQLLEKSKTLETMMRSDKAPELLPSFRLASIRSEKQSPCSSKNLSPAHKTTRKFACSSHRQLTTQRSGRLLGLGSEVSAVTSGETSLLHNVTEPHIRPLMSANTSDQRLRSNENSMLQTSISEVRKSLMGTAKRPMKQRLMMRKLKDRTILKLKLGGEGQDSSIKQLLRRQWE
jgi:CRP-like cAMP-binding protein